jgi:hypothetical protein
VRIGRYTGSRIFWVGAILTILALFFYGQMGGRGAASRAYGGGTSSGRRGAPAIGLSGRGTRTGGRSSRVTLGYPRTR